MSKVCKRCNIAWDEQNPIRFCLNCGSLLEYVDDNPDKNKVKRKMIPRDNLIQAQQKFWANIIDFDGRCRRSDFWQAVLVYDVILVILRLLCLYSERENLIKVMMIFFCIAICIPRLSINVRRLHDVGKSGFWLLIAAIPFIGLVLLLIWFALDSEYGDNQYGKNPKYIEEFIEESETVISNQ